MCEYSIRETKKSGRLTYKLFLLIYFVIFSNISLSQTFPYYHYTTKDGLVNANVYYVQQDKTGYIWFATNNGVSRFDGNTFENFYESDGLNSNSFTSIALGKDSTLYFANFEKGINSYKNGIFSKYEVSPAAFYTISTMTIINDTFYIQQNNSTFSVIYNHAIQNINRVDLYPNYISGSFSIYSIYPYKYSESSPNNLLISDEFGVFELSNDYRTKKQLQGTDHIPVYGITEDKDHNLWFGCEGKILKYSENKIEKTITLNDDIKGKVYKIFVDSRGTVWFHPMNKGLFIIKDNEIIDVGNKISIGKTPVTHIYEDREGNVWVSTSGKGVFCFNSLFISNYTEKDGLYNNYIISLLVNSKGEKLIGTFDGLNILDKDKIEKIITGNESYLTNYISEVKTGLNDNYIVCGSYNLLSFERNYCNNNMIFFSAPSACQFDSSTFIYYNNANDLTSITYAGNKTLNFGDFDTSLLSRIKLKHESKIQFSYKLVFRDSVTNLRISDIEKTRDGNLWVGTSMGLCKINGDNKTFYKDDTVLNGKINCIKVIRSGEILIAGNKGISVILQNPEKIISLGKTPIFDFSSSTSIDVDNDNNIWLGNLKGLYRIPLDSLLSGKYNDIIYFNEKTGLPSDEVRAISYDRINNELWAGTANGLVRMELTDLHEYLRPPPKVFIEKIILNDTSLTGFDNLIFKPFQNNIRIHYASFNFNSPKSITYEYKFDGDGGWTNTKYSDVDFFSHPPGKYNLLLRTVNLNNVKGEITSLKFEILAPFWKTLWFYVLLLLLLIVLIIYAALKRIEYIKNKSDEKIKIQNNISSLKHQALSASMNPHFIFNTLNSMQYYMNTHNHEESNDFIVNFSRLIRMNLDYAENTFIPLETELERLELYLKYEKLRFDQKLNYEINIAGSLNTQKLKIPNMILQPFVENSLWHGLIPDKGDGTVLIDIRREVELINGNNISVIIIKIMDDGVGLKEASKHTNSKHISKGISIIKERLELLAPDINNFPFITIKDRDDNMPGTVVTITLIPGQYKEKTETTD